MNTKEKRRTMLAFNKYRARLRWAHNRPEIWKDGCNWYNEKKRELQKVSYETDVSLQRIAGAVSLLSPLTPWQRNIRGAKQLAKWHKQRAPHWQLLEVASRATVYNRNARKAVKYLTGNDLEKPSGMKTGPFHQNLMGNLQPVTVDSWMTKIPNNNFGLKSKTPTGNGQRSIVRAVQMCATLYGIKPAQAQAVIWVVERDYWADSADRA